MKRTSLALILAFSIIMLACNAATITAYINLAVQIALQIATLVGAPPAVASQVSADLATVQKLISDYNAATAGAKPGIASQVDAALNVAQNDMGAIMAAAHVNDPVIIARCKAALAIGITAIESIRTIALGNQPPAVVQAVTKTARVALPGGVMPQSKTLSPSQLKQLYNETVSAYPQAQLK